MAFFGGVDEIVIRAIHPLHHRLEAGHVAVEQLPRRQPFLHRGLLDFLTVFVGAGEEIDVVAVKPHEARDGVGRDHFIGVPDMWRAIRI